MVRSDLGSGQSGLGLGRAVGPFDLYLYLSLGLDLEFGLVTWSKLHQTKRIEIEGNNSDNNDGNQSYIEMKIANEIW